MGIEDKLEEFNRRVAEDVLETPGAVILGGTSLDGIDSVAHLHLIIMLDEIFGVAADPDKIKAAKTVGEILALVP